MTSEEEPLDLPLPSPNAEDREFWEGCRRHELVVPSCRNCGTLRFWNRPVCPKCNSFEVDAVRVSGRGSIWTYTTTFQNPNRAWQKVAQHAPYVVALIDLEEGPRMLSNLVDSVGRFLEDRGQFQIGDSVEVVFDDLDAEVAVPRFRLA